MLTTNPTRNWPGIEPGPLVTDQGLTTGATAQPEAQDNDSANRQTDRQTAITTVPTAATGATVAQHSVHNLNTKLCVQKAAGDKSNTDFETAADY